ncbi:LysR family transcriptional regulator [Nitrospirillum amazonense]|uniref:LysR family transcriptional regulator n=1 Tax=Nitrospirillum amazonense TaxID=28077 RepID=UPI002DD43B5D|nr:LysR family transcriptional regulator [Nitrospirillum amazonense]MEC4589850.1 LysR family transcriptional regulator [Nitrospirillum amazonense]
MLIENLTDITIFIRVVATGSLSAAAREMDLSLAVVSKRLARLEERLGVRLANRTTRRFSLTDEGLEFHERCVRIVADLEEAQDLVASRRRAATGLLRVTATAAFARRHIAPRLPRFHAQYPDVRVQVLVTDTVVDLVEAGIDVAIRQAALPDSTLMVRWLAPNYRIPCAAPGYIAQHGEPATPQDLLHHHCIVMGDPPMSTWRFDCREALGEPVAVEIRPLIQTNDGEVGHAAALAGSGIVLKSIWDICDDLATGRLKGLLPQYHSPAPAIQAVYPAGRHAAAKLRAFLDFLSAELKADPCWGVANRPARDTVTA